MFMQHSIARPVAAISAAVLLASDRVKDSLS
jgi:hypothetical protein